MIDHTGIGVADVSRSAQFYDAALGVLGLRRVMQLPENVGTDGIGYGTDYPVFWIDRYHLTRFASIPPSWPGIGRRWKPFMPLRSKQVEPTMGSRASAGRITTLRLSSVLTVTTWRQSFAATDSPLAMTQITSWPR